MEYRKRCLKSLVFLLGYLGLCCAAGVLVAEGALHPGRRPLLGAEQMLAQRLADHYDSDLDDVTISSLDGTTLRGWSFRPRTGIGKAVVLLHGLGDNRLGMIAYAEMFLKWRFAVLLPDARAHGESGGPLATYGLLEAADIHRWARWLEETQHPSCIFALGESMGAAELLASLETKAEFCAVAAESPFSSFREIAYDRVGQFFHLGPWLGRTLLRPIVEAAFLYARWKYQLNFEHLSPEQSVAKTKVPVLLIHGTSDTNIPIRHSRRIAENSNALLWEIPDAEHCGAMSTTPQEFEQRLVGWFTGHSGSKIRSQQALSLTPPSNGRQRGRKGTSCGVATSLPFA